MRALYPRAARVVTVSQGAASELREVIAAAPTAVQAIPNPIDLDKVRACAQETPAGPSNVPLVLGVGRLAPEKRFDDLVQAFAKLREQLPCRLEILGEGPERARLEALGDRLGLAGSISLPGFTRDPYSAMRQAAVLVVTSDREGFGNVIVEAMALGTPVVSTDCPFGPREILDHGRWGRLVPVGDREALAAALIESLRSPPPAPETLKARAEMFDKHHAIEAYLALLDEIVLCGRQSR
jgi:glycosyltransferase involved in cell wall biosynthesis